MMSTIQREYLRNAQKAVRIASAVKFNNVAYNAQVRCAESYWSNYLKSVGSRQLQDRMTRLRNMLAAKDTEGALKFISY
jgi:hypothetical protein